MNAGAAVADSPWLLFLHADTRLPQGWADRRSRPPTGIRAWLAGCFRFALDSRFAVCAADRARRPAARRAVRLALRRPGDFRAARRLCRDGGYADLPIMEDVDLIRRVRRVGRLYRAAKSSGHVGPTLGARRAGSRARSATSRLITAVFLGVPPSRLISLDGARRAHPVAGRNRMSL